MKKIFLLLLLVPCNINASRVVGGSIKNLTFWKYWIVQNGIRTEKISFYNSDSIDISLRVELTRLKNDYQCDDSTLSVLWKSILLKQNELKTLNFPSLQLLDSTMVYLSIIRETEKDTVIGQYNLENYFPTNQICEDGKYISFGISNSIKMIFKIDSLILKSNKDYPLDLYIV